VSTDPNLEYGKAKDWIAVDLDGTLARYESGQYKLYGSQYIAPPVPAMLARVKQWLAEGKDVRIFTARVDGGACLPPDSPALEDFRDVEKVRRSIEAWCLEHIGQVLPVTNVKDYATTEIWDDRAVGVERNTGRRLDQAPAVGVTRVILTCGTILREFLSAGSSSVLALGDEVEIDDERYRVANRVWSFPNDQAPSVNVVLVRADEWGHFIAGSRYG
jgi:hypothetical protein